jgi:CHAT domain-containing protein/tetratricopeptide (TPR) repeat protein
LRDFFVTLMVIALVGGCTQQVHDRPTAAVAATPSALLEQGASAYDKGQFESAIATWERAIPLFVAAGDKGGEADARTHLAAAQMMIGRYDLAAPSLACALARAEETGDVARKIRALNALGAAYTFSPRAGEQPGSGGATTQPATGHEHHMAAATDHCTVPSHDPEVLLDQAKTLAEESGDARQQASILNNLGNFYARSTDRTAEAKDVYAKAAALAQPTDKLLACKAWVNAAVASLTLLESEKDPQRMADGRAATMELNDKGHRLAAQLPDSHEKAFLLITVGQTAEQLAKLDPKAAMAQRALAKTCYTEADTVADALGDQRSRSYACGYLGGLYLEDRELDRAEELTRRAILAAQQAQLPDSLYRWEWQNARLYRARWQEGKDDRNLDSSIRFYAAATQPVQFIRNDISLGHGNGRKRVSFRESIGSLYFEYADMLLRRAQRTMDDSGKDDQQKAQAVAALYVQAQSTVEQLKAVELENYFQDECVHLLKSKQKDVQDVDAATAVVYMIPLPDRTEILLSFKDKQYFRATAEKMTSARLKRLADRLRSQISDVEQADEFEPYQRTAQVLYKELIAPIRPELDRRHITTLVFVPDGALREIPMAVLYDGERHLIEDFAIAITPGLELLEPRSIERTNVQLLTSGLSEGRPGFKPLTYVPTELHAIQSYYRNGTSLQDKDFIETKLEKAMAARPYSIVHVASHAVFGDDASKSFLLTYNGTLNLNDIERLIRPYQLRDQPVELLTLSACQSAVGDGDQERAALGIAGIAVKAGARSAVAALWSVDEQATLELMEHFYAALSQQGSGDLKGQVSKAQAMRAAQIEMLRGQQFNHPYHWAGFLVIGNWL